MGLTKPRASQIYNLDYKQATRVVAVSNITLSGGAPALVDGVTLAEDDRVLVTGQSTGSQNGLYLVSVVGTGSNGTWVRTSDGNETGEIEAGMIVMVTEGTTYHDTQWKLITDNPITIGSTALTFTQNYSANSISGGTSNVTVLNNSSVTISSAGTANVAKFDATNITLIGNVLPGANVTYSLGNTSQRWKDLWLSNSTMYLGNITVSANDNTLTVNGANVLTGNAGAIFSTTGNITGGNLLTGGQISATGTITSNGATNSTAFAVGNSAVSNVALGMFPTAGTSGEYAIRDYSNVYSSMYFDVGMGGTANGSFQFRTTNTYIQLANINSTGITTPLAISATGNITGSYFIGNGSQLTGISAGSGSSISNGTSNVVVAASGNVTVGVAGTSAVATFTTAGIVANSIAATNNGGAYNFKVGDDAWIGDINTADTIGIRGQQNNANGYIVFGNADASTKLGRAGSGPLTYDAAFSAVGNISGGNLRTAGLISATGAITGAAITGSSLTVSTGNVSAGNIVNNNANGVGNIGSATTYFNTVFAKATSAQYADLAENYESDADYAPGTVVVFGGNKEVTVSSVSHDTAVAGIISTNPSYLMNSDQTGQFVLPVALTGRVPCRVQGPVKKGTVLVSGDVPGTAMALDKVKFEPGCIVGKSLEDINSTGVVTIEVAVGRL